MSAAIIQARYEELDQIAGDFEANKEQALNQYRILCGKNGRRASPLPGKRPSPFYVGMVATINAFTRAG